MSRVNIREQVFNLIFLMLLQLPFIYKVHFFGAGFVFFYIGFILLLPKTISRSYLMVIAFLCGTLADLFSNTLGMHAGVTVLVAFVRNYWLAFTNDDSQELVNLNVRTLKLNGFLLYALPLVFLHSLLLLILENGGFHHFGALGIKIIVTALATFVFIGVLNYLVAPKEERI